jgi:hypothetical protein
MPSEAIGSFGRRCELTPSADPSSALSTIETVHARADLIDLIDGAMSIDQLAA